MLNATFPSTTQGYLAEAEGIRTDDSLFKEPWTDDSLFKEPLVYPYSLQIMLSSLAKEILFFRYNDNLANEQHYF
jgi:hypothetical protein